MLERAKADKKGLRNPWKQIDQMVASKRKRDSVKNRAQALRQDRVIESLRRSNSPFHKLTKQDL